MDNTAVEMIWAIIIVLSGNFGIPVGVPPGPEDPVISNVAPSECLFYAGWSGTAKVDPDANRTEKWLSQPKASQVVPKLHRGIKIMLTESNNSEDESIESLNEFLIEIVNSMLVRPGCMFVNKPQLGGDGRNQSVQVSGGAVFSIADNKRLISEKFIACCELLEKDSDSRKDLVACEVVEIDGRKTISIPKAVNSVPAFLTIVGDHVVIGIGKDEIPRITKNMSTKAPEWLTSMRARLKVDRISSTSFLDTQATFNVFNRLQWWWFRFDEIEDLAKDVHSISWVSGLDREGYLTRTEIELPEGFEGVFKVLDRQPIPKQFVEEIPSDATLVLATRHSKDEILELVRRHADRTGNKGWWDDTLAQFLTITGVNLEEELLAAMGDFVSVHLTVDPKNWYGGWIASVRIQDEMSFPAIFKQMNEGLEKWINDREDFPRLNRKKHGLIEIFSYEDKNRWSSFAWCLVDDKWYFARNPEDLIHHLDNHSKVKTYATDPYIQQFFEFGNKNDLGAPVTIGHLNLNPLLKHFAFIIRSVLEQDSNISPEFEFKWSDVPTVEELTNGVKPTTVAIYRSKRGFQMLQRQTYPGSTPATTFAALGSIMIPMRTSILSAKAKLQRIGKAVHMFEREHGRLVAQFSQDQEGNRLLSWRVHLLPYLGHQELFDQFHLSEPWNSPHNKNLIEKMPAIYKHPSIELKSGHTVFVAPRQDGSVLIEPKGEAIKNPLGIKIAQIVDGTTTTAMVYEAASGHSVIWTQPTDPANAWKAARQVRGSNEFLMLFCDGKTGLFYYRDMDFTNMGRLIHRNDGKKAKMPKTYWLR